MRETRDHDLSFKKNLDEKYFFIMEKFDFEKIFSNFLKNPSVKNIFLYKIL